MISSEYFEDVIMLTLAYASLGSDWQSIASPSDPKGKSVVFSVSCCSLFLSRNRTFWRGDCETSLPSRSAFDPHRDD